MSYKIILGIVAIVVGFIGYAPYVYNVLKRQTKPHTFSWLAWGILETTAFFAQAKKGGGAGTWATGVSALTVFFIAGVALVRKDTEIKKIDWVVFAGAIIGIALWAVTNNPLTAVILVTLSDALAFVPTFRKSYNKPGQETLLQYFLASLKWFISILALQSFSLTTWLYPASLIITNSAFVIMSLVRRKQLKI